MIAKSSEMITGIFNVAMNNFPLITRELLFTLLPRIAFHYLFQIHQAIAL
jgi:hypothetical protein